MKTQMLTLIVSLIWFGSYAQSGSIAFSDDVIDTYPVSAKAEPTKGKEITTRSSASMNGVAVKKQASTSNEYLAANERLASDDDVLIFPNPTSRRLYTIKLPGEDGGTYQVKVFDSAGRSVLEKKLTSVSAPQIALADENSGIYTLQLAGNGQYKAARFVVK